MPDDPEQQNAKLAPEPDKRLAAKDFATAPTKPPAPNGNGRVDAPMPPLFRPEDVRRFRDAWLEVQTKFVDDPRESVQGADHLVTTVMQSMASTFTRRKRELEGKWHNDSEVETEDLRLALRQYRSFLNQLLNT